MNRPVCPVRNRDRCIVSGPSRCGCARIRLSKFPSVYIQRRTGQLHAREINKIIEKARRDCNLLYIHLSNIYGFCGARVRKRIRVGVRASRTRAPTDVNTSYHEYTYLHLWLAARVQRRSQVFDRKVSTLTSFGEMRARREKLLFPLFLVREFPVWDFEHNRNFNARTPGAVL